MRYAAVIEKATDGTWSAFVPDLACYVVGLESPERAREELTVSVALAVEGRRMDGRPMPPATTQVEILEAS